MPDPARILRQHAQTTRLLGVDFMPVYRSAQSAAAGSATGTAEGTDEADGSDAPAPGHQPVALIASVDTMRVEVKPAGAGVGIGGRDRAAAQRALDALRERYIADAPHKNFVTDHHTIVFGEGDPCARLMFIGEAPGEEEDRTGRPFVGRAGQLLNKMIGAMGLKREEVYICNVLKTRPPNNATPTAEEAALCAPYLFEQVQIVSPEVIVTLGLPASKTVLGVEDSMGRLRACWHTFRAPDGREFGVMPTYHPSFVLRSYTPENRAKVWSDLKMVMDRLGLIESKSNPA